jgi:tRNA-dihydrouridine synthase
MLRPLRLGHVELATPLLLAPIAGYCDLAFRTICREWGGVGLACTDLLSPQGLLRGTATSLDLARTNDFDKPVGMQLYGSDPEIMAEGARWAVEHGATVIDINMGCPVDKVTKKDGGSALLTNLERAVAIAARVVRELEKCPLSPEEWQRRLGATNTRTPASTAERGVLPSSPVHNPHSPVPPLVPSAQCPVPLTCKMRLCWHTSDYESGAACSPHLARMLADAGVVGVTVHGRTTEMKFSGVVQLPGIARVVDAANGVIPIIGNGDVRTPEDAERMIRTTGCSGVMIGRGALSMPWIFRDTIAHLRRVGLVDTADHEREDIADMPATPTEPQQLATIRRFFDLMRENQGERYAIYQINRRVSWFAKTLQRDLGNGRFESIKPFKEAMRSAKASDQVYEILERFERGELRSGAEHASGSLAEIE